jgi:streptogramin lyase
MTRTPRSSRPRASSTTSLADPSSLVGHAWGANYPTLLRSGVDLFDRASRGAPLYLKMGIWLALFFSVLATVAHAEVTWNQMGDDAGPARRVGRKLTSSNVGDFTLVDISSTISEDYKFAGAAAASNGKIVFAPRNADGVGVFDPTDNSFELVDISSTISESNKFDGAAAASNGKIVFAPLNAHGVGVFDPTDNSFELVDIMSTISESEKFSGAAAASNGKIVFAPFIAHGVGVFDPTDNSFELVDISSTVSESVKFYGAAAASNGKIVFAPFSAHGVGVFDPSDNSFELVDIRLDHLLRLEVHWSRGREQRQGRLRAL